MSLELVKKLFHKTHVYKTIYVVIGLLFAVWMLFFDSHSWLIHRELNTEIDQLEKKRRDLEEKINADKLTIQQLENIDSLEKFARENYGHKRNDETVFIIED